MKYYLETNALRALGSLVDKNKELRNQSYTSLFSIFELIKGINNRSDSQKRKHILATIINSDLKLVTVMPYDLMKRAFNHVEEKDQSSIVIKQLRKLAGIDNSTVDSYQAIVDEYEFGTLDFQSNSNMRNVRPKPEPKHINLDFNNMFSEPKVDIPIGVKNLPKDAHPSRIAMEIHKLHFAPAIFKFFFDDAGISD